MSDRILVAYASMTGSTAGVAEAIGKTLQEQGMEVVVSRVEDVKDITPYRAVVLGSAIQDRQWLPQAMQFVQAHRTELSSKPFATFAVCMTMAMKGGKYRSAVVDWLQPVRALVSPVSEGFFAGILDISKVPKWSDRIKFRLSVLFGVWSEGDHRDWNAIREWANGLPAALRL